MLWIRSKREGGRKKVATTQFPFPSSIVMLYVKEVYPSLKKKLGFSLLIRRKELHEEW